MNWIRLTVVSNVNVDVKSTTENNSEGWSSWMKNIIFGE